MQQAGDMSEQGYHRAARWCNSTCGTGSCCLQPDVGSCAACRASKDGTDYGESMQACRADCNYSQQRAPVWPPYTPPPRRSCCRGADINACALCYDRRQGTTRSSDHFQNMVRCRNECSGEGGGRLSGLSSPQQRALEAANPPRRPRSHPQNRQLLLL